MSTSCGFFGAGCSGVPLMAPDLLSEAICLAVQGLSPGPLDRGFGDAVLKGHQLGAL